MYQFQKFAMSLFLVTSCHTDRLKTIAKIPDNLKETSAIEKVVYSDLLWTIEDSGNKNNIYGLDLGGKIVKDIDISNADNEDWEDLTSDASGNLYIGDFGNNSGKRKLFTIYKVSNLDTDKTDAQRIDFKLPKVAKAKDFEAFFLYKANFYIFSKSNKTVMLLKVPNTPGQHTATYLTDIKLKEKNTKVTSAAISPDGKTVVLLNHDKLIRLTHFSEDHFFEGHMEFIHFEHDSQKEGICFKDNSSVYITDERTKKEGGQLYEFSLQ